MAVESSRIWLEEIPGASLKITSQCAFREYLSVRTDNRDYIMSIEELSSIRSISSRLRQLLARARNTKAATSIEPVLVSSEIEDDAKDISQHDGTSQQPHQAALETAARNIFFERLASCDINNIEFVEVWNLLDILQACAEHNQCEAALPLWIIEELLDSQTIDGCSKVFDYLESRRERLVKVRVVDGSLVPFILTSSRYRMASLEVNSSQSYDPATSYSAASRVPKMLSFAVGYSYFCFKAFPWAIRVRSISGENFIPRT